MITDEYINDLFLNTKFGDFVDNNIEGKRWQVYKTLTDLVDGYWSGHTAYHIVLNGGFIHDGKKGEKKKLTKLGINYLENYKGVK